jgi:hypothetical protein
MTSSINVHFIHNRSPSHIFKKIFGQWALRQVPCKYFSHMHIANFNLTNVSLKYDLDFAYSFELVFCNKLHNYILIEIIMKV